jgi:hypothetical protein
MKYLTMLYVYIHHKDVYLATLESHSIHCNLFGFFSFLNIGSKIASIDF